LNHTESCEDVPIPTAKEQNVQPIMNQDDMRYNIMSVASPSESIINTYTNVNLKLKKYEHSSNKQLSYGSKYAVSESEFIPKKDSVVIKDGECTRTCSVVHYNSSTSDSTVMDSSLRNESKKNDNPIEPEVQVSVDNMDLTHVKFKSNVEQPESNLQDFGNIWNIDDDAVLENYIMNYGEYGDCSDYIWKMTNDDCLIETEQVFDIDCVQEVGANIELSTEEMAPAFKEIICCDICDEVFEGTKEHMKHFQNMHIG